MVSKQVEGFDKFTISLRLLAIPIGFPLGQLLVDAGVVGLVGGARRLLPLGRLSMMMLLPPMRLRTVAVSSWPGFLRRQARLVWVGLVPRPCDQQ